MIEHLLKELCSSRHCLDQQQKEFAKVHVKNQKALNDLQAQLDQQSEQMADLACKNTVAQRQQVCISFQICPLVTFVS